VHLLSDTNVASELSGRFDYLLVDEYQDTNKLQASILGGMCTEHDNIMVVGDDAQSIYRFRGATVRNMLDFPKQFANTTVLTLEQNYRSVTPILNTANLLIAEATERYTKDLWSERSSQQQPKLVTCKDEAQQDEFVIERVLQHYEEGIPLRRQAVLFRVGYLSTSLELELTRHNIPYHKYGGLKFLEAAHVKDLVAFLRLLENPRDEMAWFRVLQLMDGIGPTTAANILQHVIDHGDDPRAVGSFTGPPAARDELKAFTEMVVELAPMGVKEPAIQIERIRKFYDTLLKKTYDNAQARARDLISLEQIASGYKSRRKFLVDLQLDPPTSTSDLAGPPAKSLCQGMRVGRRLSHSCHRRIPAVGYVGRLGRGVGGRTTSCLCRAHASQRLSLCKPSVALLPSLVWTYERAFLHAAVPLLHAQRTPYDGCIGPSATCT